MTVTNLTYVSRGTQSLAGQLKTRITTGTQGFTLNVELELYEIVIIKFILSLAILKRFFLLKINLLISKLTTKCHLVRRI